MDDVIEATGQTVPYDQHPLYLAAMAEMAVGNERAAAEKLSGLAAAYPGEQALADLALRAQLKATLSAPGTIPIHHAPPKRALGSAVTLLVTLSVILMVVTGVMAGVQLVVRPAREAKIQELHLQALRQEAQNLMAAGDWAQARDVLNELLAVAPNDAWAKASIDYSLRREALDEQWVQAQTALQNGDDQTALKLLRGIKVVEPAYPGVDQLIQEIQARMDIEAKWREAQALIEAQHWQDAIVALTAIRDQDPAFRRTEVEDALYQAYVAVINPLLDQANGDVTILRQAIDYMRSALELRPTQQDYVEELRLATSFVAGADASARQDWLTAATSWETVYATRPDYQGGVLTASLRQVYPQAADQLLATADGSLPQMRQAIVFLERAIRLDPENQDLQEKRRIATEFVAGAEAFQVEDWPLAIVHWGPIYASQPGYQNGVLRAQLRQACLKSKTPDPIYCAP